MDTNSLILTLLHMNGWGPKKILNYVSSKGFNYQRCVDGLVDVLNEEEKQIFKYELVNSKKTLLLNNEKGIKTINILDKEFPKKLYYSNDICVFLYYVGDISLLNKKSISIIGTRKPDEDFIYKGIKATKYFANRGYIIVSGLALGCDSIAHKTCVDCNGKTIAVLPGSCDNIQPIANRQLAREIIEKGGLLISEYSSGTTISKFNYPQRDRIQSLLSTAVLIIQASDDSGTMIAAKKSIKDKKAVYAIKGNKLKIVYNYVDVDDENDLRKIENWIF